MEASGVRLSGPLQWRTLERSGGRKDEGKVLADSGAGHSARMQERRVTKGEGDNTRRRQVGKQAGRWGCRERGR